VVDLPAHLTVTKLTADDIVECCLCVKKMKLRDMRNHVGKHILLVMRNIDENVALKPGVKVCILHFVFKKFLVMLNLVAGRC
jgi:hypothetical protein